MCVCMFAHGFAWFVDMLQCAWGVFSLLTEDIVLSQEAGAVDSSLGTAAVCWHWKHSQAIA